ncbi:hypothetical protein CYLTODRAFT_456028 [Cylindrobasidium torrendii FP15055 ss-10]|uniref:F-box domain-containing protein n=1 Tax=Cylindrobasidium torrendii FP15055 ss-10 TaxID=1314674 RepID=A0A0D7B8C3_9AGAR|nr:hypothetical protein CYLTODRAFT_456028 [Cylindrobasidium torrendii FP15055 ss-10]
MSMPLILSLPAEILVDVFERLYFPTSLLRFPDYRSLSCCSRVHRLWTIPAQRLLLRYLDLNPKDGRGQSSNYLITSSSIREKNLLTSVRMLDILVTPATVPGFCQVIASLPRLYSLGISSQVIINIPPATVKELRRIVAANRLCLRGLRIISGSVLSTILYDLLHVFPTVKVLNIDVELASIPAPGSRLPPELALYEFSSRRSLPDSFYEWILPAFSNLRILELMESHGKGVRRTLQPIVSQIWSLRLFRSNGFATPDLISACTGLKELVLQSISLRLHADSFPPSLEYINLANWAEPKVTDWTRVARIVQDMPCHLKRIRCDARSTTLLGMDNHWDCMEEICKERDIVLDVRPNNWWPIEEPVIVDHFPRDRCIEHLSLGDV